MTLHTDTNPGATGAPSVELALLHAVLEQVDYGLAVVNTDTRQLLFANAHAQSTLHPANPQHAGLCAVDGRLCTRNHAHAEQLAAALQRTKTRVRGLLRLQGANATGGANENAVAVLPLSDVGGQDAWQNGPSTEPRTPSYALLVFAKQQLCDSTSVTLFARERGLTGAEGQVLAQVCKGLRPQQIAARQGVQISTVRTQLRSIRHKTASDSIRELIEKVSVLPPMARHLPHLFGVAEAKAMALG